MISFDEVSVLDANAGFLGVPPADLMENAGRAIAEAVASMEPDGPALFLCGPGNNGGDGFVAARHLVEAGDVEVEIVLAKTAQATKSSLAREALNRLRQRVDEVHEFEAIGPEGLAEILDRAGVVVDAMLGSGLSGDLRDPYRTIVDLLEGADAPVIAVDIPTGLGTDRAVTPDRTITFHGVKEGMDEATCGPITVVDIGIPEEAETFIGPGELTTYYPASAPESHKGQNGVLAVIGGGPYAGAPAIAAIAGYRIGVDLVHVVVPERVFEPVASYKPDLVTHPVPGDRLGDDETTAEVLDRVLAAADAAIVGPGLGPVDDEVMGTVFATIADRGARAVVDADAIGYLEDHPRAVDEIAGVVTPHAGEFRRLVDGELPEAIGERAELAAEVASRLGMTVLLKGPIDLVTDGKSTKFNQTGVPRMTVGGTGDALAGEVGGLLAKGCSPYNAARIGAFVNGVAGELASDDMGPSFLASEMVDAIPRVLTRFLSGDGQTIEG